MRPIEAEREQALATLRRQPERAFSDLVLWVHPSQAKPMHLALKQQIAAEKYPAFVLWSGPSAGCRMGIVVVEWEGAIDASFLNQLRLDTQIFDFAIYDWASAPRYHGEPRQEPAAEEPSPLEQFRRVLAALHTHLDVITDRRQIPQEKQMQAVFEDVQALQFVVHRFTLTTTVARSYVQGFDDNIGALEREIVLLKHTCVSEETTAQMVLSRQARVRWQGQSFLAFAGDIQEALEQTIDETRMPHEASFSQERKEQK